MAPWGRRRTRRRFVQGAVESASRKANDAIDTSDDGSSTVVPPQRRHCAHGILCGLHHDEGRLGERLDIRLAHRAKPLEETPHNLRGHVPHAPQPDHRRRDASREQGAHDCSLHHRLVDRAVHVLCLIRHFELDETHRRALLQDSRLALWVQLAHWHHRRGRLRDYRNKLAAKLQDGRLTGIHSQTKQRHRGRGVHTEQPVDVGAALRGSDPNDGLGGSRGCNRSTKPRATRATGVWCACTAPCLRWRRRRSRCAWTIRQCIFVLQASVIRDLTLLVLPTNPAPLPRSRAFRRRGAGNSTLARWGGMSAFRVATQPGLRLGPMLA
mmetsp:Transcript_28857/g.93875  ORF Transcript_28857/g.93875 Transcript_28857/m.93875 type:complete len:325 (-) Transcript_28857:452-1426(-)